MQLPQVSNKTAKNASRAFFNALHGRDGQFLQAILR
jgi:hypothetical protein